VYGIPGFDADGQDAIAHVPLTETDAVDIAERQYGLAARQASRLETERDDTFRLETADETFVLKVAHPADTRAALELGTLAAEYAARSDATLSLPRTFPSVRGDLAPALADHGGRHVCLLSWLPGGLLLDAHPSDGQLRMLGDSLGRLTAALTGFSSAAAIRPFAWDPMQLPALATVQRAVGNSTTAAVFELFQEYVEPRKAQLPRQVVHNDFNPGNVLVDPDSERYVTGIIDFGDCVETARVCDLAVALSYQLFPLGRTWANVMPFVDAYLAVVPLDPIELAVLPTLVAARFVQRILIYRWMERGTPESLDRATRGNLAALAALLKEF
jgi:hydroxylysine kinase